MEETMKIYATYKDRLFRMIFSEKEKLLELYNAMNGTAYENPEDLVVNTLENAIYMGMKNDVSFLLYEELTLYEQQSTKNPNMPLRDLFYVSSSYSALTRNKNIYGTKLISLPEPKFVVFYNGSDEMPERSELKLSDAYTRKSGEPELELRVQIININPECSQELMTHCRALNDYMRFVGKVRKYAERVSLETAVEWAIEECIHAGIMADFLRKNKAEVKNVCIFEYDEERHIRMEREEAREEGERLGREEGIRGLVETCTELETPEKTILEKLKEKFSLTSKEAEKALETYGKTE